MNKPSLAERVKAGLREAGEFERGTLTLRTREWIREGHLTVASSWLDSFCQSWKISSLSVFGSVLRDDFGPSSDIDLLVTFLPETSWDIWELGDLQDQLEKQFGRSVDLVRPENIRNPIKRKRILETRRVIYESEQCSTRS